MAIFHCQTKPLSRSGGRSAVAASAYRVGAELTDERTGIVHNFIRRSGVESADLLLPAGAQDLDRGGLWNQAERAEVRKDARTAREWVTALPSELRPEERRALALEFASALVERYGVAVDVAIHAPGRRGDDRNHHAHLLTTTRRLGPEGLSEKADIELSDKARIARGLTPARKEIEAVRALWAGLANAHLERAGRSERIDHRTLAAQGIDRVPTQHQGPAITAMERRGKEGRARRALGLPERPRDVSSRVVEDRRQAQAAAGRHREAALAHEATAVNAELTALLEHRAVLERQQQLEQAERTAADLAARVAAISERWAKLQESKAQTHDQAKAPVPDAAGSRRRPSGGRQQDPEQVYAAALAPIRDRRQREAAAGIEALRVERRQWTEAVRTHQGAEPRLFGRGKWEQAGAALDEAGRDLAQREGTAARSVDPQAIDAAAVAELRRAAPGVVAAADQARKEREAREQEVRRLEQETRRAEYERAQVGKDFHSMALSRQLKGYGYGDDSEKWRALPSELKAKIEDYNRLPKDQQPAALERIGKESRTAALLKEAKEINRSQERSR